MTSESTAELRLCAAGPSRVATDTKNRYQRLR
jgi:hypothetical protein